MATRKRYDTEYKIQAVKLALEIGQNKASRELGLATSTINGWCCAANEGRLNLGTGNLRPLTALSLSDENAMLRQQIKALNKENRRLQEINEILAEASAFFASSRRKSAKMSD